jgi:DNA polymerase III sliding clamp (beta) subunit (PCNA family)
MLASRLLTGQFPNYESVLPKENGKAVELNPDEFGDLIRRVSLLAMNACPVCGWLWRKTGWKYRRVHRNTVKHGQETLHIGFNAEYLCAGQLRGARRRAPFERGIM